MGVSLKGGIPMDKTIKSIFTYFVLFLCLISLGYGTIKIFGDISNMIYPNKHILTKSEFRVEHNYTDAKPEQKTDSENITGIDYSAYLEWNELKYLDGDYQDYRKNIFNELKMKSLKKIIYHSGYVIFPLIVIFIFIRIKTIL